MRCLLVSACASYLYPMELHQGALLFSSDYILPIPRKYPFCSEWGECLSNELPLYVTEEMPIGLEITWLSVIEHKFYRSVLPFPKPILQYLWDNLKDKLGSPVLSHILIGLAPYGNYSIWFYGVQKSVLLALDKADEIEVPMHKFLPNNSMSLSAYCDYLLDMTSQKYKLRGKKSHREKLFEKYMYQFKFRYQIQFKHFQEDGWLDYNMNTHIPNFEYIEESLYDGTHDKLHDGGLMKYHQAGKPKKLRVQWHIGKSEYSAYFWFEDERIRNVFDKFYGTHPDTKTDFIIRIDAEQRKYELALYRYGLKEPQIIPEDVYQLLVFKNKFEDYRSENYNQERGAWIW